MKRFNWRSAIVSTLAVALVNVGFVNAAQAGIVDTAAMIQTTRDANLEAIQAQLARAEVRSQLEKFGVGTEAVEQRLASLSDAELATLSKRMQEAPAGGDGLLVVIGLTFVVLLILELVGVINIFNRV